MNHDLDERHDFAIAIALEAGELGQRYFRHVDGLGMKEKAAYDVVTAADLEIDRLMGRRIAERFPEDGILSEESVGKDGACVWVIDPIDGTANFARGIGHFAISIACWTAGHTEIGIIHDPVAGETFTARRGGGAFCNGSPIRTSLVRQPRYALIEAGYSRKHPLPPYLTLLRRLLDAGYEFRQAGSAAKGLAEVACGRIDGYCEFALRSWDVLAGVLLVAEAGGWTTNFNDRADLQTAKAVLAAAPHLAESLRDLTGIT